MQSAYLKAQATYVSNKADFEIKRKNYEKFKQLYDKNLISEDEYLAKKTGYLQGESDLKSSEAYNFSVTDLYSTLKSSSLNFPSGYIREGDKEYLVKVSGEAKTLEDIKEIVLENTN